MSGPVEKPRIQCKKCPWRVNVNPRDIPGDYCAEKHKALVSTIANPKHFAPHDPLKLMACHETATGKELPCVGWLANQLGPGNNLNLRFRVLSGRVDANVRTVGRQHRTLEDTLPKDKR